MSLRPILLRYVVDKREPRPWHVGSGSAATAAAKICKGETRESFKSGRLCCPGEGSKTTDAVAVDALIP